MIKQLIKGTATFIPGSNHLFSRKRTGGSESARYCYSVWLRHLVMAHKYGFPYIPKRIAELGPGDSIGVGLAALISGSEKYYAFDIIKYGNIRNNIKIFNELVTLFKNRKHIPDGNEFPEIIPLIDSYVFPDDILTERLLGLALDAKRLLIIKNSITNINKNDSVIRFKVPWHDSDILENDSIDFIISQAVLEHIDDIKFTYLKMHSWLKTGCFMSHSIDFRSHGFAKDWDGHWAYSEFIWKLIKGNRPFLINRLPYSEHIKVIKDAGFKIVCNKITRISSTINHDKLAPRFRKYDNHDLTTSKAYILSSK